MAPSSPPPPPVCLPTSLDAFVLNEAVCNSGATRIAPITLPNYVSLRLENSQIQHDILPRVDLHNAQPAIVNPRISKAYDAPFQRLDPKNPAPPPTALSGIDRSRLGVYLHWTVPRAYRSGSSQAAKTTSTKDDHNPNPQFKRVPNRWLLIRILRDYAPKNADTANIDKATAWVIESDKLRKLNDIDKSIDLETDVTPFVAYSDDAASNDDILNNQAENYIGMKVPLSEWAETQQTGSTGTDRVKLTVMNTSNPVFADYAIHNPNVFSTKDNFWYKNDAAGNPMYLDSAVCDYIVVGWQSDPTLDLLGSIPDPNAPVDLQARISNLFCTAPVPSSSSDKTSIDALKSGAATRLLCHSARYSVKFDLTTKPSTPGDDYAKLFTSDVNMEPVAVGTSPLDAVLAFFKAHEQDKQLETDVMKDKDKDGAIAKQLLDMRELLYATEDDYDSRIKAADLIFGHNWNRSQGGSTWHFDKKKEGDGPPAVPSDSESGTINQLNELQHALDTVDRKLSLVRWCVFSEFFKYVSDPSNANASRRDTLYTPRVSLLRDEAKSLMSKSSVIQARINALNPEASPGPFKKVANDPFHKRMDPTLCLAGIDAGWDPEFLSQTPTRFKDQIERAGPNGADVVNNTLALIASRLGKTNQPADFIGAVVKLVTEASGGYQAALKLKGHKVWIGQPFCPQFIEWEGIYYHIDDDQWKVDLVNSALSGSNHQHVTYTNPNDLSKLDGPRHDQRHVSGRMLVLPQPSFALGAVVAQVLSAITPSDQKNLPPNLQTKTGQDDFIKQVQGLPFISGELTGLTDALLTMATGQHVKPNVRKQGEAPTPMKAAVAAGSNIGLKTTDDFKDLVGAETGRTPYGTLTDFSNVNAYPFKAVQHGQFAITRLTIVDKFGQALPVPGPQRTYRLQDPNNVPMPQFIHPCLSEQLIPSQMANGALNTVFTPDNTFKATTASGYPMTPFIQLTPSINQEARINAAFVEKVFVDARNATWKTCLEWENPIFGWVVVNYADSALQFFTADGTFYTALEFGGPTGTIRTQNWLPFDPPKKAENLVSDQLDALIKQMTGDNGSSYLLALWDLINQSIQQMPFPPSDYAQYANAIVGKPLAFTNVGWSLELAQPPLWEQHTLPPPASPGPGDKIDPLRTRAQNYLYKYEFPVKIGDADRPFDGIVAYWDITNPPPPVPDTVTFKTINTYFPARPPTAASPTIPNDPRKNIAPSNFPTLKPYFIEPEDYTDSKKPNNPVSGFEAAHAAKLTVKTVLMDPYTPVHLYSGILPIKALQLPAWTIKQALSKMTAFFTMGPLLLTKDVPKVYDAGAPLEAATWLSKQNLNLPNHDAPPVRLPIAGGKGMWNWLQPYSIPDPTVSAPQPANPVTRYNALELGQEDGRLRVDPAPYTFVEGFLQLARPLTGTRLDPPPGTVVDG